MSLEPSTGLEQWFGSESAAESNRNLMGLQDPAVDRLIEIVVAADTREEMVTSVNALDRVLRAMRFWVPQWYKDTYTVAYYDMFAYPEPLPPYDLGYLDFWRRLERCIYVLTNFKSVEMRRLHPKLPDNETLLRRIRTAFITSA